jgi:hypothetical protein
VSPDAAPLIVSALLGSKDFAWLDDLRREYYPAEHNRLPAHLTLFRHPPPSLAAELRQRLKIATQAGRPAATAAGLVDLDGGVAVRIASPALEAIRADLADALFGLLMPQDQAGWQPHVTIQNKVPAAEGRALTKRLVATFVPRAVRIDGLAVWSYWGGLWEPVSRHMFRP